MVNLEWYRSFVEIYRVGTVSGAATLLHLTQPAVSQHLAGLESTLGTTLFERQPRRMVPTEAGKRLYTRVVAAIETLEAIPAKATSDRPWPIRLGTPPEFFSEYLLAQFTPGDLALITVQFGLAPALIDRLLANHLDCVIATQKIIHPQVAYQLLFEEYFWLIGPPGHTVPAAIARDRPHSSLDVAALDSLAAWLKEQPWIAYGEDLPIIRRFWRVVFGQRLDVNPQWIIPDLRSIRSAIAQGLGYSILPNYLCADWLDRQQLTLVLQPETLQPDRAVTNAIWLAYRQADRQAPFVQQILAGWGRSSTGRSSLDFD
ncbi:LysR family transcriptional regulator [Limnothrix sp. FACHB-1083]|uniref:LysR family transcriptional regulator n=1 Tax=unclassified Limnothrix TaxID=2632864 RepID=UPI0016818130|nr:LysR family transcriptional regulator [Limnothrix sp. FACHB-1083]MBD2162625.1 LysR family transcriptional regulator [Limnothrix sp. FACHB-1083]MBD2193730.1 LysR family transcriptional regulator [Limnothrix sp. FACHB-1088]